MPREVRGSVGSLQKPIYTAGIEAAREYNNPQKIRRKNPRVRLVVNPFVPPYIPLEFLGEDTGDLIRSVQFAKSRNNPGGTLTVTLVADDRSACRSITGQPFRTLQSSVGESMRDIFRPMTLALFYADDYHIFTGYLRDFRKSTQKAGGGWERTYTATFEELGTIYNQSVIAEKFQAYGINQSVFSDLSRALSFSNKVGWGAPLSTTMALYVSAFIASTLGYVGYTAKPIPRPYFSMSDGLPLAFRLIATQAPLGALAMQSIMFRYVSDLTFFSDAHGASFWQFLQSMAPQPWMELFTETGGRTIVTGRVTPPGLGLSPPAAVASVAATVGPLAAYGSRSISNSSTGIQIPPVGLNVTPMLPGFNYLVARTSPFDIPWLGISLWITMSQFILSVLDLLLGGDFIIFSDDDVAAKDLGVSERQQYTMFDVSFGGKSGSNDSTGLHPRSSISHGPILPIFPGGASTYGSRIMQAQVNPTSTIFAGNAAAVLEKTNRMYDGVGPLSSMLNVWFRNQGRMMEGSVSTRGMPYAKPGMLAIYAPPAGGGRPDDMRELGLYYIDNVVWNYTLGQPDTSEFSLIRGVPLPMSVSVMTALLRDWEILPPGLNLSDFTAG